MTSSATSSFDTGVPSENVVRGVLFALIALPVGVALWVGIWSLGFIASIVAFAIAAATAWLYRKGAGGVVSKIGATIILLIVLLTLGLAFYFGLVTDYVRAVSDQVGLSPTEVFTHPAFWPAFNEDFPEIIKANGLNLLLALAFGVIGVFSVLRRTFASARQATTTTSAPLFAPPAPPAGPIINPGTSGTLNAPATEPKASE